LRARRRIRLDHRLRADEEHIRTQSMILYKTAYRFPPLFFFGATFAISVLEKYQSV
jgi:hypothetical protein